MSQNVSYKCGLNYIVSCFFAYFFFKGWEKQGDMDTPSCLQHVSFKIFLNANGIAAFRVAKIRHEWAV